MKQKKFIWKFGIEMVAYLEGSQYSWASSSKGTRQSRKQIKVFDRLDA